MQDLLAHHPETARALQILETSVLSSGFANTSYNGLDAFHLVNAAGASTPVRRAMVAVDPYEPQPPAAAAAHDKNYLFDALITRVERTPAQWRLV